MVLLCPHPCDGSALSFLAPSSFASSSLLAPPPPSYSLLLSCLHALPDDFALYAPPLSGLVFWASPASLAPVASPGIDMDS